jgi:TRAP-type C4-dicarboxylate transport system substrate-binding protein
VYTSPLACVGLQWFTKVKYVLDVPMANSNGAVLLSKRMFKKLSPEQQAIIKEKGKTYFDKLTRLSRRDNTIAMETMLTKGIRKIEISDPALLNQYYETGKQARRNLVGKLYSAELLNQVESALETFRKSEK